MPGTPSTHISSMDHAGVDVRMVMDAINFEMHSIDHGRIKEYTHRISRIGRIDHPRAAISLH
ncbi:uncharacterized protein TRIVIDRAFT_217408 [Trichoderma virens Gv29-8]|uniref:Uncharacterized protein n=1 Tax=Hypocrea virens (strain Gv29-8 / FGSC 10586) TaxID=413071 RepID=G9MDU9_HYPVG|nr:uncharacterized protein TRIVIDRAFT_217408 [Trichoderma virens Gv29-8]EHK26797.1 hypothetical protein TRIVIDRAFT_217408 [Trichoderma virens Gv29-8]UKZ57250.1 hypothetical protein TrVGV298_011103 [Trichoderma virens]